MEKLNDALNEKLKSLSMEVCTVTLLINEFEGTIDLRTLCTRAAVSGTKRLGQRQEGGVGVNLLPKGLLTMCSPLFCLQVKTVQVERQTLQEEHDRLMGRQSLLLQELASKEKG